MLRSTCVAYLVHLTHLLEELEGESVQIFSYKIQLTFIFIPCILNNKCLLYTNICTNKWGKFMLKLLQRVSVLIHHFQGVCKLC